ncbi:MAG: alpha/beta fold hydrolase [Caldilineaceae bacterium]
MHTKLRTQRHSGLVLTEHEFVLPLDHAYADGEEISVFAREVVAAENEGAALPWLLFLQGGPGFGAPRPMDKSGWLKRALQEYRVLLLDQRGTGRSSPVNAQTLARLTGGQAQADYLMHFRADAIVQDAEAIRRQLVGADERWSVLGQSYGGFCITRYLCAAADGLAAAFITGGLPPLERTADEVYRATYRRVMEKNRRYYARYPEDAARARLIVEHLANDDVRLPNGDRLTPRRFQQLGLAFGASDGFEQVHYLLEEAFVNGKSGCELSYTFLHGVESAQAFDTNPIFAILHEAIYCQQNASNWAAARVRGEYAQFDSTFGSPVYFTGEMIYPWMFEEYRELRPLQAAAEILAEEDRWPRLYDVAALRANRVPCAAAVYYDDMYVERTFSEETAQNIAGIQLWITNQYEHNGLRADGEVILDRLIKMARGMI